MDNKKKRLLLLLFAAFASVGGIVLCGMAFLSDSRSYADMLGIGLLILGVSIFFADTLM